MDDCFAVNCINYIHTSLSAMWLSNIIQKIYMFKNILCLMRYRLKFKCGFMKYTSELFAAIIKFHKCHKVKISFIIIELLCLR